ncbi:MAG: type IV secretion system protein VirB10 [Succinivibrio sp.]|nr:type IV secretion system protein VirB10 [Succinivibrio sp.]
MTAQSNQPQPQGRAYQAAQAQGTPGQGGQYQGAQAQGVPGVSARGRSRGWSFPWWQSGLMVAVALLLYAASWYKGQLAYAKSEAPADDVELTSHKEFKLFSALTGLTQTANLEKVSVFEEAIESESTQGPGEGTQADLGDLTAFNAAQSQGLIRDEGQSAGASQFGAGAGAGDGDLVAGAQDGGLRQLGNWGSAQEEPSDEALRYASGMMVFMGQNAGKSSSYDAQAALDEVKALAAGSGAPGYGSDGDLARQMNSMSTPEGRVSVIPNMSLTLSKGTFMECVLETKVNTAVPGLTTCVLPRDIYSMDGKVLLLEKGTRAIGEYQGSVRNGQERIFMLWSELRTPQGVKVQLDSPAAGALGEAGIGGYVDHHWWQRFGNAFMFSLVADGFDYAVALQNRGNNNVSYNNSEDSVKEIIKAAMEQSGNIAPTLVKNQGEMVGIMVARDIDFSSVYRLRHQG